MSLFINIEFHVLCGTMVAILRHCFISFALLFCSQAGPIDDITLSNNGRSCFIIYEDEEAVATAKDIFKDMRLKGRKLQMFCQKDIEELYANLIEKPENFYKRKYEDSTPDFPNKRSQYNLRVMLDPRLGNHSVPSNFNMGYSRNENPNTFPPSTYESPGNRHYRFDDDWPHGVPKNSEPSSNRHHRFDDDWRPGVPRNSEPSGNRHYRFDDDWSPGVPRDADSEPSGNRHHRFDNDQPSELSRNAQSSSSRHSRYDDDSRSSTFSKHESRTPSKKNTATSPRQAYQRPDLLPSVSNKRKPNYDNDTARDEFLKESMELFAEMINPYSTPVSRNDSRNNSWRNDDCEPRFQQNKIEKPSPGVTRNEYGRQNCRSGDQSFNDERYESRDGSKRYYGKERNDLNSGSSFNHSPRHYQNSDLKYTSFQHDNRHSPKNRWHQGSSSKSHRRY